MLQCNACRQGDSTHADEILDNRGTDRVAVLCHPKSSMAELPESHASTPQPH